MRIFLKSNWYTLGTCFILLLAAVLRFTNYHERFGFAYDQAHDAIIARFALENIKIPLVGPFSSAGNFQTGGEWYWLLMLGTALFPWTKLGPWIFLTILSLVFILLLIHFGSLLVDRLFGMIVGILSAVSIAGVSQSLNLTNQTPLALFSLLAIFAMHKYVKEKKPIYLFFLGFFVSLGASIHLQGASLFLLLLVTLFFTGLPSSKALFGLLIGIIIPVMPILLFDLQNDFTNLRGIVQYYLSDQYKVSFEMLGRRWITYLGVFWPNAWAKIVGVSSLLGIVLFSIFFLKLLLMWRKAQLDKTWQILLVSFILMLVLLRYIRTPLFDSYLVFLHPYIFLFSAFALWFMLKTKWLIGAGLIVFPLIIILSILFIAEDILKSKNSTSFRAGHWLELLTSKYPEQKFSLYDYKYSSASYSLPLVFYLQFSGKLSDSGYRIGLTSKQEVLVENIHPVIKGNKGGFILLDLQGSSSASLKKNGWAFVNPSVVYRATEEWHN